MRRPVRDDFAIVDTAGEFVQAPTIATEVVHECGQIRTSQISHSLYSKFPQLLSCNSANSRQAPNRQRQKKRIYALGLDDKEPIRFAPKFSPPRRVPHGVTLIGRLFDEGTLGCAGLVLERTFNVMRERPPGF